MSKRYGCVDKHPVLDTRDTFIIGSCVRAKQFVDRVGYKALTNEEKNDLMRHLCRTCFHIPESDVIIPDADCGEVIDWRYFPTAYLKHNLSDTFVPSFEIPERQIPYLKRPAREDVMDAFKYSIRVGYKTGAKRQVFYKPNENPDEVFVVIGKRIAKIGKYVRGYFESFLGDQSSVQIYIVTKGLYGPTYEVAKDDLILMEYAIPATPDKDGNMHNWRVSYEWEYEKLKSQFMEFIDPNGVERACPRCHSLNMYFDKGFVTKLVKPWNCVDCGWSGYKEEVVHETKKA